MGQVAFNRTPTNLRVPLFYAEVNSGVSYFAGNSKHLVIGQMLSGGTATVARPVLIDRDINGLFGKGSMLVDMIRVARKANPLGEIWALPVAEPSGASNVQTLTVASGVAGQAGTFVIYVCGRRLEVNVLPTDTNITLAANIAAAINAGWIDLDGQGYLFPVSAAVGATGHTMDVVLTSRHTGTMGNFISIDFDIVGDEGVLQQYLSLAATTAGTGTPTGLSAALGNLGNHEYDMISMPYTDTTSLNLMRDFLADTDGRWDPTVQLYGHCFTTAVGGLSALATLGTARNDPHVTIMGVPNSPTPPWSWAASLGGLVQLHKNLGADLTDAGEISRPMQTLIMPEIMGPKKRDDAWERFERQSLYFDGISAFTLTVDGQVSLDRVISTYSLNSWGSVDTTWLDIETLYQTVYGVRFFKHIITQKHPRDALIPDNPGSLQGFTTPKDLRDDCVHAYAQLVKAGVMKNNQLFADSIVVEQADDPNRVNAYLPFDVANQLRIFAANVTTFLNHAAN